MTALTLEIPIDHVIHILKTQKEVIEQQAAQIKSLSRAPSEASMRVDRDGICQLADHCQKLTPDALQGTEKMVLHRGNFLRESEFNAVVLSHRHMSAGSSPCSEFYRLIYHEQ